MTQRQPGDRATVPQPVDGGQFYDDPQVLARYLDHRHSPTRSPNIVMEEPAFMREMGDVGNQRVLDLGCGDGTFADVVMARGGSGYVGVDASAAMIAKARHRAEDQRVVLVHESIENYRPDSAAFDLVASRMALHYIENLDSTLATAAEALRPGGRLVFTVVHPVITSTTSPDSGPRTDYTVDSYFERGPRQREWFGSTVTWHHRTIDDYVSSISRCGLKFVSLSECEPDQSLLADHLDELHRRRRVPLVLLLHAERPLTE